MSLLRNFYHALFRRSSTFALVVVASVFVFERAVDQGSDYIFETINKGKLYKDIAPKWEAIREEQEE